MKKFSFILFIALFSSCALISRPPTKPRTVKKSKAISKPKPQKVAVEYRIVEQAEKRVSSVPLTKGQLRSLKALLKDKKVFFLTDRIKMILGRHFSKKNLPQKALFYYSQIKTSGLRAGALLAEAKIYHKINRPKKALRLIKILLEEEDYSPAQGVEAYVLKLSLLSRLTPTTKDKDLLEIYCHILSLENKSHYKKKAGRLVFDMNEKDLLEIHDEDFTEPVQDLIFYRAGKIFFFRGKFEKSRFFFKKFLRFSTESTLEEKALKYIQAIDSRKKVHRKHIGAVLPLSGPSANIGKRSLKGLQMALGFYTDEESPFQLIVLDSRGQPDRARKAVQTLVTKHHVIAVMGGVLSGSALALAEEAQNFGVPAVLMSQKPHLTKAGQYVFQNGLTSALTADHLTTYLIDKLKIRNFAILYPNDPYGVDHANAFWSAVEQKGGKITGAQFYKPGETDFNGPLRRLTGTYYMKDRIEEYKNKLKAWYLKKPYRSKTRTPPPSNILPPVVDFEVLFIPDSLKALSLIAPHIAYNDIKNIKLAGPALWNRKDFLKRHSKYIDNIVFVDPGLSSEQFRKTDFYKNFVRSFDQKPGLFEVLGYESALALRRIIAGGADTRNELREELTELKKFYGPTGKIRISDKREFLRSMRILKVEKNTLSPVTAHL